LEERLFIKPVFKVLLATLVVFTCAFVAAAQIPDVQALINSPKFKAAEAFIDKDHDRFIREIIQITEIEAPPFKEQVRARAYIEMLRQHGLVDVEMDPEGNVMGIRKGTGSGSLIAIAAHLDTVFPAGTNVQVKRKGTVLSAPGIGDNSRALAVMLAMIRAMDSAKIQTTDDILFVADVGEEGVGDLRGIKYLFQKGRYKDKIKMFLALDPAGPGNDIIYGAVGSKRYKVVFRGPGGHSYGAFGLVNPAFALGNAITKLSKMIVPVRPRTTFNVGVVGGGISVNSIPSESWMEVDIRSESKEELIRIENVFLRLLKEAVDEENNVRSTSQGPIEVEAKVIGDRPSGETSINAPIVQTAAAVIRAFGMTPVYNMSSTDSNIPISMGLPAITFDSGGRAGRTHALDEWIDVEKTTSVKGILIAMGILLSLAGGH
jgi:acetylornithine deacetylase/succinyl-diaminopimelate desuccinylase-like protein